MMPGPQKRFLWYCLALILLVMVLILPPSPSLAKSSLSGYRSHPALKCLVGSFCGDVFDGML